MSDKEKLQRHLDHLIEQHALLDKEIQEAYNSFDSDLKVKSLKLRKLHVKEEIEHYKKLVA